MKMDNIKIKNSFSLFVIILLIFSLIISLTINNSMTVMAGCPPPQFSNENPTNGSIIEITTCDWSIVIENCATFNWTIECDNGQSSSGNDDTNEIFYLNLTGLVTLTLYNVWVNASNWNKPNSDSYIFTVIIPSVPVLPGGGGGWFPPVEDEEPEPEPITEVGIFAMALTGIIILILFLIFVIILTA